MRLTITLSYNLSNNLQTFVIISHLELHLNTKKHDSAKSLEEVRNTTLCTNAIINHSLWFIPQHESELHNQVVENLMVPVNFRGCKRIRLFGAPEKRTTIEPLPCNAQEGRRTALT